MTWLALVFLLAAAPAAGGALSQADLAAVRELDRKYVEAWLAGEPKAVLALFSEDAVIIPSGLQPIQGHRNMRRFWWPEDGSTTTIETYETRITEVRGADSIAWAWGTGHLAFTWEKDGQASSFSRDSTFTLVARREPGGSWKMTHRTWTDLPRSASLADRAREFRALLESNDYEAARRMMSGDPRRWWESKQGEGRAWQIGPSAGPWAAWDKHFDSEREVVRWTEDERSATVVVRETNDYFRLLERGPVLNEITYSFDDAAKIDGLLIRAIGDRPPGRTEEFRRWAAAHAPAELEAVMTGGEIDPSDPARFRALLNRWREASGLSVLEKMEDGGRDDEIKAMVTRLGGTFEVEGPEATLVKIDLHRTEVADEDLAILAAIESLRELDLRLTKITDAGVRHLGGLTRLETLNLFRTNVTDEGLAMLTGLRALRTLLIGGTGVTDEGLESLRGFDHLRKLSVFDTAVSDGGIPFLGSLPSLEILLIGKSKITEAGAAELQRRNPRLSFREM